MLKNKIALNSPINLDYKVVGLIAAAIFLVLGCMQISSRGVEPPPQETMSSVNNVGITGVEQKPTTLKVEEKIKAEGQRRAREAIAEQEQALVADYGSEETPDRLMAIGNLYQYQLNDYSDAIQNYQTLIETDPDHSQVPQAYVEIAHCYKQLGDEMQARYVYQEMVDTLDPSLQHVQFAKAQLGED